MMKAPYARPEQRRETRSDFPAGQLFIVDLIARSHGLRTFGIVLNISKGGMAVQTFRPLPAGHVAEIRHCFSKTPLYTGAGQVVWKKEGSIAGLRFLNGRLKNVPELRQRDELDGSPQSSDSAPPLHACRSNSSTNALDSTLHLLAYRAMALTDATGVAIVLGNSSTMECRASVGVAPEVGTQLSPDHGLSGHSLRSRSVIVCKDAWADPRVNVAAARQMDTRSILIVPITMAGSVVGLVEAFSPDTNHFDERHVERLQPLVMLLASVPELETVPPHEPPEEAPEQMASVAAQDTGVMDTGVLRNVEPEEPAATEAAATEMAEEITRAATNATEFAVTEPAITGMAASSNLNRTRAIPVAGGVVAGLLILLAAMALFTYRFRTKSAEFHKSSISTQNSQPSNAGAGFQGAIAVAKPKISFDPPVIHQKVAATFSVSVVLKNGGDILSAPMQIRYDPQKLQIITVASGGLFDRGGHTGTLVPHVDPSAGRIDIALSRPLSVPSIAGDGPLVTMTFLSKVPGHSQLQVNPVELRDNSSQVTLVNGAVLLVDVSPSKTKAVNNPAKPAIAKKELPTEPATPVANSATRMAPPRPTTESKAAPEAPLNASVSVEPESSKEEASALVMQGVPPGSELWLDNQPLTATAPSGKVAIRNIPPGMHHLRMSLHHYQYYDQFLDLKPGEVVNVEPKTSGAQTGGT